MSEQTAPEPTMEEILASIRRIISEDDAPAGEGESAPEAVAAEAPPEVEAEVEAEAEPEAQPEPEPEAVVALAETEEDDVLELTEKVAEAPASETIGDLDVYRKSEPEPEPAPEPVAAYTPPPAPEPARDDTLVSEPAAVAAASSFGKLSAAVQMPAEGRTLEDVTRELLRPLLKAWLDEHLPSIVQAKVDEEVERIARSRVR